MGLFEILAIISLAVWLGGLALGIDGALLNIVLLSGVFFLSLRFFRTAL